MKKSKRMTALILSALMAVSAFTALPVSAATTDNQTAAVSDSLVSGDFKYSVLDDGTVEISKYNGNDSEVVIPDTIDGKAVTSIGRFAFFDCTGLTSITISDSVTSIGYRAFSDCTGLTSIAVDDNNTKYSSSDGVLFDKNKDTLIFCPNGKVGDYTIPDSVTSIGDGVFRNCTGLTSITIPDSVTSIGGYAFEGCTGLTSITIPDSVTSIGFYAFSDCTGLTSIAVDDNNTKYSSSDGVLFDKNKDTLIFCPNGKVGDYTIPDSVTSIGDGVFRNCTGLTSITIPNSVKSIGDDAFSRCTGLTSITIPDSVTSIGVWAFDNCSGLTSITIPDSITSIGYGAFSSCTGLTSITIPDSVTSIGYRAFRGCTGLTSITIPDSVTSIVEFAFENCTGLTSITIPDSVTSIGGYAFEGCTGLTSITIPDSVTSIGYRAFGYYYDENSSTYVKMDNFTIKGYRGTAAETYANENGFEFVLIDNKNFIDDTSGVEVSGVMLDDAVLSVTELENTFENAVATYDITLQSNGTAVQPDGTLTVKIPSNAENCKVMWLKDDGSAENMNAEYTDGCYVFTTNHLSVYALVQNNKILTGDSNGDGILNVNDVTYLQLHISGRVNDDGSSFINTENKAIFDSVDMNKDGKLDVQDVTALQIHIAGN